MAAPEHDIEVASLRAEVEQLKEALSNRDVIGQAKGLIMASAQLSDHEAFQLLVRQSQRSNRKLRDVAGDIVAGHNARAAGKLAGDGDGSDGDGG